ncbi:MAG: hypothetical protein F4X54_09685, partial [Chloroflexi bacterium]|nr:hypothetical protein [Chloroflexota bacterium]
MKNEVRYPEYRDDPAGFVENVLGAAGKPYSKQREMLEAVAGSRRVSVVGANGCGKGWALARLILWWVETRARAKVVVLSSTQRQVREVLWQELAAVVDAAGDALSGKLTKGRYFISPDRFAIGFATNNPDNIHGFHSPELLMIVDEAHAVRESHFDAALRLNPVKTLLTGNAFSTSGTFYESHHGKRHQYHHMRISAYETPNLTGEEPARPGLITAEDIADKALHWGLDHPKFIAAVYAQFPDTLEDSLVGRTAVEDAMREDAPTGEGAPSEEDDAREPVYIGVDVGRFGTDESVLCARRGQRIVALKSFGRVDTMRTAGETALMARELGAEAIFVDEGGLGGGVVDRLRELKAPVHGVQFGRKAMHPTRFRNLRSEIFWELRRLINDRLIALPDDEELAAQLLSLRYDVSSSGQVVMESKRELRKRNLPSPDRADALALAFMTPPSLQIWTGYEPFLLPRSGGGTRPRPPVGIPVPPSTSADDEGGSVVPAEAGTSQ